MVEPADYVTAAMKFSKKEEILWVNGKMRLIRLT